MLRAARYAISSASIKSADIPMSSALETSNEKLFFIRLNKYN